MYSGGIIHRFLFFLSCSLTRRLSLGYPLFAGEDEEEQLAMIIEVIGLPPEDLVEQGRRKKLFFGQKEKKKGEEKEKSVVLDSKGNARYLTSKRLRKRRPGSRQLEEIVRRSNCLFIDFLRQCLQ